LPHLHFRRAWRAIRATLRRWHSAVAGVSRVN
jgi:hypothetical protein